MGGKYADYVVRKWIAKRDGVRIPEDRMRSALPFMGIVIPICVVAYGWSVERDVGGIPVVVIMLFTQGVAQLFCFPSLNAYCLDVMQGRGAEVIAGNYFMRYLLTVSAMFLVLSAVAIHATVLWGKSWRETVDRRRRKPRNAQACQLSREGIYQKG
jgi:hypothetical protein